MESNHSAAQSCHVLPKTMSRRIILQPRLAALIIVPKHIHESLLRSFGLMHMEIRK